MPINEDALSHTLGPERNGRVRAMGFGITPSQVGVHMTNSKKVEALQNEVSYLKNQLGDFQKIFFQRFAPTSNENGNTPVRRSESINSRGINEIGSTPSPRSYANENRKTPSPLSQNGSTNIGDNTNLNAREFPVNVNVGSKGKFNGDVGSKCKLLNWHKMAVAEATIASTDPNVLVHHVSLGTDCWKVWVKVALDPKAALWRPNSFMSQVEDAVGSTVAWHKDFISFD